MSGKVNVSADMEANLPTVMLTFDIKQGLWSSNFRVWVCDQDRFPLLCSELLLSLLLYTLPTWNSFLGRPEISAVVFTFEETQDRILLKGPRSLFESMY